MYIFLFFFYIYTIEVPKKITQKFISEALQHQLMLEKIKSTIVLRQAIKQIFFLILTVVFCLPSNALLTLV